MPEAEAHGALREEIVRRLDEILDPCSVAAGTPMGLAEMGLVDSIEISQAGDVAIRLCLTSPGCHMVAYMESEAIARVGPLAGVRTVAVRGDCGLDWSPDRISPAAQERRRQRLGVTRLLATTGASVPTRPREQAGRQP